MTEAGRTVCVGPPPPYNEGQREATAVRSFNLNPSAPISRPEVVAPSSGSGSKSVRRGGGNKCSTFFWITAGLGWVVWIFSVSATVDQNWIEDSNGGTYGVRSDEAKEFCDAFAFVVISVCIPYDLFSASQIFSTVMCSVAIVLYTVAFFRPAEAPHGSSQALGLVGGILMIITAFFQMLAFLFADMATREWDNLWSFISLIRASIINEFDITYDIRDVYAITEEYDIIEEFGIKKEYITGDLRYTHGPTYIIGIVAFVFSAINAIAVFVSYRQAGDGPVPCRMLLLANAGGHSNANPPLPSTAHAPSAATA